MTPRKTALSAIFKMFQIIGFGGSGLFAMRPSNGREVCRFNPLDGASPVMPVRAEAARGMPAPASRGKPTPLAAFRVAVAGQVAGKAPSPGMALSKKSRGSVSLVCRPHAIGLTPAVAAAFRVASRQAKAPAVPKAPTKRAPRLRCPTHTWLRMRGTPSRLRPCSTNCAAQPDRPSDRSAA
jgi:hypothetical protein